MGARVVEEVVMMWKALLAGGVIALGIGGFSPAPAAEGLLIVAVGASNTYGMGVSRGDAYPAQLQALLRADGLDVTVRNEGISGENTDRMLTSLPSTVPQGTHIVILQAGSNDGAMMIPNTNRAMRSPNTEVNIEKIVATLRERHIQVLLIQGSYLRGREIRELADKYDALVAPPFRRIAPLQMQADHKHYTPTGYRMIAEALVPLVKNLVARIRDR
jgi:acyl-CoA thioesterase I